MQSLFWPAPLCLKFYNFSVIVLRRIMPIHIVAKINIVDSKIREDAIDDDF
jgi:hypothetical protein